MRFDATLRYSMDGCRSKNAIACDASTFANDARDKDRKKGRSSSKMGEGEVKSEELGIKSRVCNEGASDEIWARSLSLSDGRMK
jgi:hypothetical protein